MDRELSLLMLVVLAVGAWFVLRSFKVWPPVALFVVLGGFSCVLFGLSYVT